MPDHYTDYESDTVAAYKRTHRNNDETHVFVAALADDRYVAYAVDVDPPAFRPMACDTIAYAATEPEAVERAEAWMRDHDKGVKPGAFGGVLSDALSGVLG